jgi:hypothetical protein
MFCGMRVRTSITLAEVPEFDEVAGSAGGDDPGAAGGKLSIE